MKKGEPISRRDLLRMAIPASLGLFAAACNSAPAPVPQPTIDLDALARKMVDEMAARSMAATVAAQGNPTALVTKSPDVAATTTPQTTPARVTATVTARPDVARILESQGYKVDLHDAHPDWPKTYGAAAQALTGNNGHPVSDFQMVPAIDDDKVWRGWWNGEPGFKLKSGIRFDGVQGCHVDATGKPLFKLDAIFDFSKAPKPEELANVQLNVNFAGFFARRGGVTRDGQPQHASYFSGTPGSHVEGIEQLTLIPVYKDLCPGDWTQGAITRAYRMAVANFRDNKDARDGFEDNGHKFLKIYWFNPESGQFQQLDGRLIAELAREKQDLSIIEKLPAGWPVAPETVSSRFGGRPDGWVWSPTTGEWFFEAFPLLSGVNYIQGTGHMNGSGLLLVGSEQADGSKTKVFNFKAQPIGMAENMYAPGIMSGLLFVRVGDAASNANVRHNSWYTSGNGNVMIGSPAIEQATAMPLGQTGCPASEVQQQKIDIMRQRAQEQPDPMVKAWYWDGGKFVLAK